MKGIIIAAGPSSRLRPITDDTPKCMLNIKGKPLLKNTIDIFFSNGIKDVSVIRGYKKEKINYEGLTYFDNDDFMDNNILHSLMHARSKFEEALETGEDVIVTYSDIWYEPSVVEKLIESDKAIASIVDTDWEEYYEGRTDHPISEAENIIMDDDKKMLKIGKHIFTENTPKDKQGEFIGLWKFTPEGIKIFLKHFDRLNASLKMTEPYQNTKEWQKSYITDIFQEMIDKGEKLYCVPIQQGWYEFDTVQDFKKIGGIIE
ncbi:MAG: phosphocholine cytidylyltransferase family protein [archaeon]